MPFRHGFSQNYGWIPITGGVAPIGTTGSGDVPHPRGYVGGGVCIQIHLTIPTIGPGTTADFTALYPTEFFNPGAGDNWCRVLQYYSPVARPGGGLGLFIVDKVEIFSGSALNLPNPQSVGATMAIELRRNLTVAKTNTGPSMWSITGAPIPTAPTDLLSFPGALAGSVPHYAIGETTNFELGIQIRNESLVNSIVGPGPNAELLINVIGHEVLDFSSLPLGEPDVRHLPPVHAP